ncbi:glycosyltransferase family 39 protein [Fortiea sp. LEGE XX443]|uniref:glycosyltransferase family 39 protein n=1 Tax=Fortiea sp. LEGE XX443 TaxID=1828611 RepID=UPI00187E5684|nr:glycosyltransferase family 39 protein [Fortiea sp. LEGE XX443]MBE9006754.1 glycosyltransferase family 39 protein [Fortiea sp. LEGE XX443]
MINSKLSLHYLGLVGAIALGAVLRFWHLDLKPLWMDEVITSIFSLGKNYHDLPLDVVFPLERVQEIFTFNPGVSCNQIATDVDTQSTHPPLFFCAMYEWLGWMSPLGTDWVAKLRSLPALFGVATIPAIYCLNRLAFSKTSGIIAALVMATSPFAVYLSQEARHYTAPMFLITLSLLGLMQIQQDIFERSRLRIWVWLSWTTINSICLYIHYFFGLALIAEIATLILLIYRYKLDILIINKIWLALFISSSLVFLSFTPWLLVIFNHVQRAETNWLATPNYISPLYQTVINWILMIITIPVENQPLPVTIISGFLMVVFFIWVGQKVFQGWHILCTQNKTKVPTMTLLIFTTFVLLEFFIIIYLFSKDITLVPRYNFVYYPSFCALLAASINVNNNSIIKNKKLILILLTVGTVSCIIVASNLAFKKPFQPEKVALNINLEPSIPIMLVTRYGSYQDVALGLSFALALEPLRNAEKFDSFAFINQNSHITPFWKKLSQLPIPFASKLNLWIVAPGLRRRDYQPQVTLSGKTVCHIDHTQHYRIGIPYQLYRCSKAEVSSRQISR